MLHVSRFPRFFQPSRPSLGLFLLLMGLLVPVLTAACGGDDPTPASQGVPNTLQPPPAAATQTASAIITVGLSGQGSLGSHLVDADGMTLYLFTNDDRNASNCSGGCAGAWPPLLADGDLVAGEGLDADRLATIQREDGSNQVTYKGRPLYHFASDRNPGDTLGQDRGGVWYVVSPDGGPIGTTAEAGTAEPYDY